MIILQALVGVLCGVIAAAVPGYNTMHALMIAVAPSAILGASGGEVFLPAWGTALILCSLKEAKNPVISGNPLLVGVADLGNVNRLPQILSLKAIFVAVGLVCGVIGSKLFGLVSLPFTAPLLLLICWRLSKHKLQEDQWIVIIVYFIGTQFIFNSLVAAGVGNSVYILAGIFIILPNAVYTAFGYRRPAPKPEHSSINYRHSRKGATPAYQGSPNLLIVVLGGLLSFCLPGINSGAISYSFEGDKQSLDSQFTVMGTEVFVEGLSIGYLLTGLATGKTLLGNYVNHVSIGAMILCCVVIALFTYLGLTFSDTITKLESNKSDKSNRLYSQIALIAIVAALVIQSPILSIILMPVGISFNHWALTHKVPGIVYALTFTGFVL